MVRITSSPFGFSGAGILSDHFITGHRAQKPALLVALKFDQAEVKPNGSRMPLRSLDGIHSVSPHHRTINVRTGLCDTALLARSLACARDDGKNSALENCSSIPLAGRVFVESLCQALTTPLGVRRGERLYNVRHPEPECLRGEGPRNRTMDVQTGLYNPRLFVRSMTSAEGRDSSRPGRAEARPSKPITIRPCPHHLNSGAIISYKISMQSP